MVSLGRGQGPKAEELINKAQILKGKKKSIFHSDIFLQHAAYLQHNVQCAYVLA